MAPIKLFRTTARAHQTNRKMEIDKVEKFGARKQRKGRTVKFILRIVIPIASILLVFGIVSFYKLQSFSKVLLDIKHQVGPSPQDSHPQASDDGPIKIDQQSQLNQILLNRMQSIKETLQKHRVAVVISTVLVLLVIGGTIFGVLYKQSLDDQELATSLMKKELQKRYDEERIIREKENAVKLQQEQDEQEAMAKLKAEEQEAWKADLLTALCFGIIGIAFAIAFGFALYKDCTKQSKAEPPK